MRRHDRNVEGGDRCVIEALDRPRVQQQGCLPFLLPRELALLQGSALHPGPLVGSFLVLLLTHGLAGEVGETKRFLTRQPFLGEDKVEGRNTH